MTYDELCKKMKYNPLVDTLPEPIAEFDDRPSPCSVLTYDELLFMEKELEKMIAEAP